MISEITDDILIAFRNTFHVTKFHINSEIIHGNVIAAHIHQITFDFEINLCVRVLNIHALIAVYAQCKVSNVVAHKIHLQIDNASLAGTNQDGLSKS